MSGVSIEARNLSKKFDEILVLDKLNLKIEPGEFIAIVGRSGCGKSTLLRLITYLEQPTEGDIYVDGNPVRSISSDVRFVFQDARLLNWKSVLKNVILGSATRSADDARVALKAVGLADREGAWPLVLSGGQRQRVSLARAIAGKPRALLLDEPLGALDALTRIEMQRLIEDIWARQKFTAVLVTHDVAEAVTLADRVLIMDDHKITQDVKIELSRPRIRNSDFAYYEQSILKHILGTQETENKIDYVI